MRLDRYLTRHTGRPHKEVLRLLAARRVAVDGELEQDNRREVDGFTPVALDGETLPFREGLYFMLHKPAGYLSATSDPEHPTVIELIEHPQRAELHLAGRLDRASTGLLLLTNNGRWSKNITEPGRRIPKTYLVDTRDPIGPDTAATFARGIYFAYEDLTTQAAELDILSPRQARLRIHEGRYHQVKRMFHALGNRVTGLHREAIGPLGLDPALAPGEFRPLTAAEIAFV
jgi:16S rRNA pseudouridine516 synthase